MVEEDKLFTTKVKHKGTFDFKECYRIAYEWLIEEGYDVEEDDYKEVVAGAKEIVINWTSRKKVSGYFRFVIKTKFHLLGITDVEVEVDGIKQKLNKGQFEFHVSGILEKDYKSEWDKNKFMSYLRRVYDLYIIPGRIENYEAQLLGKVDSLCATMKSFLNLNGELGRPPILI